MDHTQAPHGLHVVITKSALIIVRRDNASFRDFQDEFADFVTSHGPHDADGILDTFENEWPDVLVIRRSEIKEFLEGRAAMLTL